MIRASAMLILLTGTFVVSAQDEPQPPFEHQEGRFRVVFPSAPKQRIVPIVTKHGKLNVHLFTVQKSGSEYVISYSDLPAGNLKKVDVEDVLDFAQDGAKREMKAEVSGAHPIGDDKLPGREFVLDMPDKVRAKVRLYVVGNRLYQVMVIGTPEFIAGATTKAFLDSLQVQVNP